ncbi:MAG: hypothetical protein M3380_12335, partial [Chloroflexota bacterium]|nr:hypothetical protein [Chloroflexota bacterium]
TEAIERPGANQVVHLRRLMESRPFFERVPDQELIVSGQGEGRAHLRATRDREGRYAMIFFPDAAGPAAIDLQPLAGDVRAWWYDTHMGQAYAAGELARAGTHTFTPPLVWHDWVLVLDEAAQQFDAPGVG